MLQLAEAFATFPVLQTARFHLRAFVPEDATASFEIMSNPEIMRYYGIPPMKELAEAVQQIEQITNAFQKHDGVRWAIISRETNEYIGSCGFWRIAKPHDRAEIGYELSSTWWNKGVMTEVAGAIIEFGFSQMKLHSIEAQIDPDNIGSQRVLEKLGFRQEGLLHENYYSELDQRYTDTAMFSLLNRWWEERSARLARKEIA